MRLSCNRCVLRLHSSTCLQKLVSTAENEIGTGTEKVVNKKCSVQPNSDPIKTRSLLEPDPMESSSHSPQTRTQYAITDFYVHHV